MWISTQTNNIVKLSSVCVQWKVSLFPVSWCNHYNTTATTIRTSSLHLWFILPFLPFQLFCGSESVCFILFHLWYIFIYFFVHKAKEVTKKKYHWNNCGCVLQFCVCVCFFFLFFFLFGWVLVHWWVSVPYRVNLW